MPLVPVGAPDDEPTAEIPAPDDPPAVAVEDDGDRDGGPGNTATRGTRGGRHAKLFRIRADLERRWIFALGAAGILLLGVVWAVAASRMSSGSILPSPGDTWTAMLKLRTDGVLTTDLWASLKRILIGYSISVLLGIVFGLAIGAYTSINAYFEPQIGFLRYIPASALTPLFLLWLGIGESPKISLIVVGTVFFNILMMADVARNVPRELLNAAYTLGAGRWKVMSKVIFRYSVPGIIDAARVNLAAAWLMLVVAELLAAQEGLAYQIVRAQRFRAVDTMFAILIVFGLIGLVSDLGLRWLRSLAAPWAKG